ncbi:dihydroxyacetone phosphate acyltransferase isoform X2 [Agrilus planipennis]|uniref:Dihydroxyacetone phosphate acyltransferase isoform X2 n=1 Tax=Agrilus planipennis TaxID=224129 RepID=A0A1W4WM15_AGRPL|nr:dihydroxyacetone phosphate acyltransferase isoform X2 [Agrilus planipennis]
MEFCNTKYVDILENRRKEWSNLSFMYREISPVLSYRHHSITSPEKHKENVLNSSKIQELIKKVYQESNVSEIKLEKDIGFILDEIGFEKELTVVRWLGWTLLKLYLKGLQGILVNECLVFNLRSIMGNCPVIFVPSHRSYVDFTVMSYLCFHYDIELPAIAAGIDFKGMAIFGKLLRQVGAFYMRRSFRDTDFLYWQIFQQYIEDIMTKGHQPIEFFIEGTRSRTGKSLYPKLEVPDILFVPVNLSYDRVLEERLFAFELLGVPKPKESTKGFFRSLRYLHQDYGNVYVTFCSPISAADYFSSKIDRSVHNLQPKHAMEFTNKEKNLISQFAVEIVDNQQRNSTITFSNLIAAVLLNGYSNNKTVTLNEAEKDVLSLKSMLNALGANIFSSKFDEDLKNVLEIHKNLFCLHERTLQLVKNHEKLTYTAAERLKGHNFLETTMNYSVPFILLQEYVNPLMYFCINPSLIVCILKSKHFIISKADVFGEFTFLRSLFSYEFVGIKREQLDFENCWCKLKEFEVISYNNNVDTNSVVGKNTMLISLFDKLMEPFFVTYYIVASVVQKEDEISEKSITEESQALLEELLNEDKTFINPYILSLNSISNCIFSLSSIGVITRIKIKSSVIYRVNYQKLAELLSRLRNYVQLISSTSIKEESNELKLTSKF